MTTRPDLLDAVALVSRRRGTRKAAEGGKSLRAIAGALAAEGILSPSGRPYSTTTIARLLKRAGA